MPQKPGSPHYDSGPIKIYWPPFTLKSHDPDNRQHVENIWLQGVKAEWWPAARCPCGVSYGNSPDGECPQCYGSGWFFPIMQEIRVIKQSVTYNFNPYEIPNPWESGTSMFTIRSEHCPGRYDRIVLVDSRTTISAMTKRRGDVIEKLRYNIVPHEISIVDGVSNSSVIPSQLDVMILQGQLADGSLGPLLVKGSDFDITEEGWIDWTKGDAKKDEHGDPAPTTPPVGNLFTIVYKTVPVYRVVDFPHATRDTRIRDKLSSEMPIALPSQFMGKIEWMPNEEWK